MLNTPCPRLLRIFLLWENISMNQIYMSKVISELMFYSLDKLKSRTNTKKLKTKIFFVGVNENSTTFLYTLNGGGREKKF